MQLFAHREQLKLQTKNKEGDATIEYYYSDGELGEKLEETRMFCQDDERLEGQKISRYAVVS